jgi:hypothetical protein
LYFTLVVYLFVRRREGSGEILENYEQNNKKQNLVGAALNTRKTHTENSLNFNAFPADEL